MKATDFQCATADRILHVFRSGQNRILLADEVGLGKTIVAKEVIRRVSRWHREELRDPCFKVVYICSNIQIAAQNITKLGITEKVNVSNSRLSMQHFRLFQSGYQENRDEQLIPLTPATSFSMTSGCGTIEERALMYLHLVRIPELARHRAALSSMLRYGVGDDSWDWSVQEYRLKINQFPDHGKEYYHTIASALDRHFGEDPELYRRLTDCCLTRRASRKQESRPVINDLRRLFASISLEQLNPDLVIMDEFQRFRDLIAPEKDSEEAMLNQKFLGNSGTKVLLLSATPYKPYSTLEEIAADENADHYSEFMEVMNFLFHNDEKNQQFHRVWQAYSDSLCELSQDSLTVLLARKQEAEDAMYQSVCRTERFNTGIIDDSGVQEVPVSTDDILSYDAIQTLMDQIHQQSPGALCDRNVPMDYVKSAPYLLSFMDQYQLKRQIQNYCRQRPLDENKQLLDYLLISKYDIHRYHEIRPHNARLQFLSDAAFGRKDAGAELLLWIPASRPYYRNPQSIFEKNRGYSKILVFSSWEMVPRMISIMLSYEAERRTIGRFYREDEVSKGRGYFVSKEETRFGAGRLKGYTQTLICYPSRTLARLYQPAKNLGKNVTLLRQEIGKQIENILSQIVHKFNLSIKKTSSARILLQCLEYMDGINLDPPEYIPSRAVSIMTDMALASPAICCYRLVKKYYPYNSDAEQRGYARDLAYDIFVSLFNKPESAAVLDLLYGSRDDSVYYQSVLRYCVEGDLQAVLDEYAHVLADQGADPLDEMVDSFSDTVTLQIDTQDSFPKYPESKAVMRTHFARGYFNAKVSDQKVESLVHLRKAFNSPFRPFVLSTTSIGQEGLDFHLYCRRVMHWNLPSNPVDLEQREGRVNRYKCLAVRQNIAHKYGNLPTWEEMFRQAAAIEKGTCSDLVPYWCLPDSSDNPFHIERLVPMYPMSRDRQRYERIIKILSLYRLTLGQPRQEELIALLDQELIDRTDNHLFMNLCPYLHAHAPEKEKALCK